MEDTQQIFNKIDALAAKLKALQPVSVEYQKKLDLKFRLEFNFNSNHIEGNTLTYGETELLLIFDGTKGNHTSREYDEMKAHDVAYHLIQDWANESDRPLTEGDIKNLNKTLLVRPFWKEAITPDGQNTRRKIKVGDYKQYPNSVRLQNGEIFEYASPAETPIFMGELIDWYRTEIEKQELHPVALAALLHYKFVRIHPFDDGNGRISRLLMNYVLLKNDFPPIIVKSADKRNYLMALNNADTGDLNAFVQYIAQQLIWSLELSIKAAKGESIEEPDDLDKEIALLKKELSKTNVLDEKATTESISKAIEDNIIPLFILIEEKCADLKDFFFDFDRVTEYKLNDNKPHIFTVGSKDSIWAEIVQTWLHDSIMGQNKKIKKMNFSYHLKGFKKNISANSFQINVDVNFNDFNYTFETNVNRDDHLKFAYNKKIEKEELMYIVKPLIKNLLENIRRANNE